MPCRGGRQVRSPVPYPAGIDMHEVGLGIIANSSSFHGYGSFSKFGQRAAGQSDVYGLSCHMQAVFGNAAGVTLEVTIGGGRSISGDNFKGSINGNFCAHGMENVQQVRIDDFYFIGPVVA